MRPRHAVRGYTWRDRRATPAAIEARSRDADVVAFLASPAARWITGTSLAVHGVSACASTSSYRPAWVRRGMSAAPASCRKLDGHPHDLIHGGHAVNREQISSRACRAGGDSHKSARNSIARGAIIDLL